MIKTLTTLGAASAVGLLGVALPSQAAAFLDLSSCPLGVLDGCVVPYTGGSATISVMQASGAIPGTPGTNPSDDLAMGIVAPGPAGGTQTVKITFTADPDYFLPTLSLKPPGNEDTAFARPFNDYRDNWMATLAGANWDVVSNPINASQPGAALVNQYPLADYPAPTLIFPDAPPATNVGGSGGGIPLTEGPTGSSTIDWSFPYALSTERAFRADWELSSTDVVSMLTLDYFSSAPESDPLYDDANSLRIHVTAEPKPVVIDVPEPTSAIASVAALGLGMLSLRNKNRNSLRK